LDDPAATGTELPLATTKTGKPSQAISNNIDLGKHSATVQVRDEGKYANAYVQLGHDDVQGVLLPWVPAGVQSATCSRCTPAPHGGNMLGEEALRRFLWQVHGKASDDH
jgi:hypothetical protein